jgi:predicted ester cyclase
MPITAEEARDLIHRLEVAMNARTLDDLDDVVAPNFVRRCQATPDVHVTSREQFKEFLVAYTTSFPDNVQTFTHVVAEGDVIGIWATYQGTHTGPLGPFPPTGRKVDFEFGGIFRAEDGKLAEFRLTWDNMTILAQLGLLPDPTA